MGGGLVFSDHVAEGDANTGAASSTPTSAVVTDLPAFNVPAAVADLPAFEAAEAVVAVEAVEAIADGFELIDIQQQGHNSVALQTQVAQQQQQQQQKPPCGVTITAAAACPEAVYDVAAQMYGVVTVTAGAPPEGMDRAPVNIVAVIDVSGSMRGAGKMDLTRSTLRLVARNLGKGDHLSIVTYSDKVHVVQQPRAMDTAGKQAADDAIGRLQPTGQTNLSGGLLKGVEVMRQGMLERPGGINSILLMTDGFANVGVTDAEELIGVMRGVVGAAPGYSLYTFGCGAQHNDSLLRGLSEVTDGAYYFIDSADAIPASFGDCLGGLMSVVAQNITLTLTCQDGAVFERVQSSRPVAMQAGNTVCEVTLGDLQSEEERDVLVSMRFPALPQPRPTFDTYMRCNLTYLDVQAKDFATAAATIQLARPAVVADRREEVVGVGSTKVSQQIGRFRATAALAEAKSLADNGEYKRACAAVQAVLSDLEAELAGGVGGEYTAQLVTDLRECVSGLRNVSSYTSEGRYRVATHTQAHNAQRSNNCQSTSFTTPMKSAMRYMSS